jgi:hypothetical protein
MKGNGKKPSRRPRSQTKDKRRSKAKPTWHPLQVVTRAGKTTIRQLDGRRFVRFGEFRGRRVAWVEFYTCGTEYNSISIRFQDRTVVYFKINPMFTLKPEYCRHQDGELQTVKEWPEIRMEKLAIR